MPMFSISDAAIAFEEYAIGASSEELNPYRGKEEPVCLADCIQAWMQSGEGVRACLGDRQTFTLVVIAIIDHWLKDPSVTDYVRPNQGGVTERRVHSVFGDRGFDDHDITDSHWFATCTFHELHGMRP